MLGLPASIEDVNAALMACQSALMPVHANELIAEITVVVNHVNRSSGAARVEFDDWWEDNERLFVSLLADLPADLVKLACWRWLQRSRFVPAASEIRAQVAEEFAARKLAAARLKTMAMMAERPAQRGAKPAPAARTGGEASFSRLAERARTAAGGE